MRAARLLSILFEIESRPGLTAQQLADELEVSLRTIYRDVAALQTSGVPLYGRAGRGGGLRLVEGYRSRAATLRADEAAALLMGVVPVVAEQLGLSAPLARAERKVLAQVGRALGEAVDVERGQILIDPIGWYRSPDESPHLATAAYALRHHNAVTIRYRRWEEPTLVRRRVEPHGLVLKAGVWYLMARSGNAMRTYRVNQIVSIKASDVTFAPDPTFDLSAAWEAFLDQFRTRLSVLSVDVRLTRAGRDWLRSEGDPAMVSAIAEAVGTRVDNAEPLVVALPFESIGRATSEILRLGLAAEAVSPPDVVRCVARTAAEVAARYVRSTSARPT
jgi:predicted DNA-binding transcriptional regulator YafY